MTSSLVVARRERLQQVQLMIMFRLLEWWLLLDKQERHTDERVNPLGIWNVMHFRFLLLNFNVLIDVAASFSYVFRSSFFF